MTDGSESVRDRSHFPFTSRIPARQLRVSWRAFCICVICRSTVTAGELWGMNNAQPFINRQQQQHNVRGTGKMSTKVHGPQAIMCCYLFLNGPPAESIQILRGNCSQHLRKVEQPILLSIWGGGRANEHVYIFVCTNHSHVHEKSNCCLLDCLHVHPCCVLVIVAPLTWGRGVGGGAAVSWVQRLSRSHTERANLKLKGRCQSPRAGICTPSPFVTSRIFLQGTCEDARQKKKKHWTGPRLWTTMICRQLDPNCLK